MTRPPEETIIATIDDPIEQAREALRIRSVEHHDGQPEYTLVVDPFEGIGIYARQHGLTWHFIKVHDGDNANGLAAELRATGADVTVFTDIYDLAIQGTFQPTVKVFHHSPHSIRHAAEAAYLYREADRREAEWATGNRWGDSGASQLRIEAGYALARLKELNPGYDFNESARFRSPPQGVTV